MSRSLPLPLVLFASAVISIVGCGGGGGGSPTCDAACLAAQNDAGHPADGGSDAGSHPDGGTTDGGTHTDGGTTDGGTTDGGTTSDGGTDGGTAGGGTSSTMVLDSVTAQVAGLHGYDVRLAIAGHDSAKGIAAVMVRALDGDGNPVPAFDSHQSGTLDSELGPASPAAGLTGKSTISTSATIEGLIHRAPVGRLAVSLRDLHGLTSNEISVSVAPQPMRARDEACDPLALADHCLPPLGCVGAPPVCSDKLPPDLAQVAFQKNAAGPVILIAGVEREDDLSNIHVDFEDAQGNPIMVHLDGDNAAPVSSFDLSATGYASNGTYLVALQQAPGFDAACPQIALTPTDAAGATGATKNAMPVDPPIRGPGAACDPRGFDVCATGYVCVPAVAPATSTCQSRASLQAATCSGAVQLAPTAGKPATTFGHTSLPSLWDAPHGCSAFNPIGRPEGVAKLVLATTAATLQLSLDNNGTDFDTTMYLMAGCPSTSASATSCDDDNGIVGVSSVINLENVPAGTYTVVIDSFKPRGGNYQLTATVN